MLGSPGVYDRRRDALSLAGALEGWDHPKLLSELRAAFGPSLMIENDVDAAALAERAHGHGRDVDSFAFVSVGTGVGMGLVLDGKLRRGAHGAAGEIAYLPLETADADAADVRRRGGLEAAASAAGIVHAARQAGMSRATSARQVFQAAARGDARAQRVVLAEAVHIARAICSIVAMIDPDLVVLGGGIGKAAGLVDAVRTELDRLAPVPTEVRVTALGSESVVDGCLASGLEKAWTIADQRADMTEYVIAADGGNSKTDLVVATTDGEVLSRVAGRGTRPYIDGLPATAAGLAELARSGLDAAGLRRTTPCRGRVVLSGQRRLRRRGSRDAHGAHRRSVSPRGSRSTTTRSPSSRPAARAGTVSPSSPARGSTPSACIPTGARSGSSASVT